MKKYPTIELKKIEVESTPTHVTFPTPIIQHGNSLYMKLPRVVAEYYDIKAGDTVLLSLLELRRCKEEK